MIFWIDLALAAGYLFIAALYILHLFSGKELFYKIGRGVFIGTCGFHFLVLIYSGYLKGQLPLTSVFEALTMLAAFLSLLYLVIETWIKTRTLGPFTFPLLFILQIIAAIGKKMGTLSGDVTGMPIFVIHTISSITGYAFFIYSMILGILYLYLFREIKKKEFHRMFELLPPLEVLDRVNAVCLYIGFGFLSIGIGMGSIMAVKIWNGLSLTDPKIFLTLVLWIVCLASIIFRIFFKWSGKKMSYIAIADFLLIIIIFLVESFAQHTLHRF